jgi:hypothetical protein
LRAGPQIANTAPELMKYRFCLENRGAPAGGYAPFRWLEGRHTGRTIWRGRHEGSRPGND